MNEFGALLSPFSGIETGDDCEIACAQLCGLGHDRMRGMLFADTKATPALPTASPAS